MTSDTSTFRSPLLNPRPTPSAATRVCACLCAPCTRLFAAIPGPFAAFSWVKAATQVVWKLVTKEPAKTIHSLKMAFALCLAFLLVLVKYLYDLFGSHAVWAVMTVVVVFEYSTGASLSKGYNRGAGTLLAGILAVAIGELAGMSGEIAHPFVVGLSVFVVGSVVTFAKMQPSLKPYEFGFRTFVITFSLIMVAEYRQSDPVSTAINRFLIILLGAGIGIFVNICILPLWAGEELHNSIAANFDSLADSLEVCVKQYLHGTVLERVPSKIFMGQAADDPVYNGYRACLISASKEDSLASFATWEPPHGRFRMLRYPWHQYVKLGAVLRHCTYSVVALHGCLRSAIQAPLEVRRLFDNELQQVGIEGAAVLRKLGKQVQNMEKGDYMSILDGVSQAVECLQQSLYLHSYLLVKQQDRILEDNHAEDLAVSVIPDIKSIDKSGNTFYSGCTNKLGIAYNHTELNSASRRCVKKLHSWPARPMDDFDFAKELVFEHRVRVLESADALSLGTFATLLMEVALRFDYVVEAVEELSESAHFADYRTEKLHDAMNGDVKKHDVSNLV